MSHARHAYEVSVEWVGNRGTGTSGYRDYDRAHVIRSGAKADILGSSDPSFRGDPTRWNPEDLLVASVSACHKLWYLSLCAQAGVTVLAYEDDATGEMVEDEVSGGRFTSVRLRPRVTVRAGHDLDAARRLHHEAHRQCYIANSVNFPITCEATVSEREGATAAA